MTTANLYVTWQRDDKGNLQWTYGNWGGKGWSMGKFNETWTPLNRSVEAYKNDPLDNVFKTHDMAYEDAMLKWKASAQTTSDTRTYWQEIINADKAMKTRIDEMMARNELGTPPFGSYPGSPQYQAAAAAQMVFSPGIMGTGARMIVDTAIYNKGQVPSDVLSANDSAWKQVA